jgi:hypothetical protein
MQDNTKKVIKHAVDILSEKSASVPSSIFYPRNPRPFPAPGPGAANGAPTPSMLADTILMIMSLHEN